jgi:molybdopterin synthase catalytic subunit
MADTIRLHLLAFATAADALGGGEHEVEMAAGSTVADLRARLDRDHPALAGLWPRLAVAVDGRLAGPGAAIPDGAEVALLPPVSGGVGEAAAAERSGCLADGPLDAAAAVARVASPARGAVVTFLGTVRDHHQGRPVDHLVYDAYRPMAEATLARIVGDLEAAHRGLAAVIVHRLGEVPAGEPSVVIAVASPHRAAAWEASRTALERLKTEVPIWKREHYADGGAAWREEEPLSTAGPLQP